MSSDVLENLVKIGNLHKEKPDKEEIASLVNSAKVKLQDAQIEQLNIESRFDLAYNASHALALAALRSHGYRSSGRYLVFQCLEHTLNTPPEQWRVLDDAHRKRNNAQYEGNFEVSEGLVDSVIEISKHMLTTITSKGDLGGQVLS